MVTRLSAAALPELLENGTDQDIRSKVFALPSTALRSDQPLFRHQAETLANIERNQWASGIVHLPTGAGKTRIAIEVAARRLHADPMHRIVWASYPRLLIRQGMARLVELAALFPAGTTFQWAEANVRDSDLLARAHVTFLMRDDLSGLLEDAADRRITGAPFIVALGSRRKPNMRVTLIYDECHQLGAKGLQSAWRRCQQKYLASMSDWPQRFQTIGLSATPLPTGTDTRELLQEIFPLHAGTSARPEWRMLVHASITNKSLENDKILCPVNLTVQEARTFDIPSDLIRRAGGDRLRSPGRDPNNKDLRDFSERFNRNVMSDEGVLRFLATRLAANLDTLGKTLVFAPTIDAANRLAQLLKNDPRVGPGRVSVVHSRLNELIEGDDDDLDDVDDLAFADVNRQISEFKSRGDKPCIMVNVGMLTTGFDDPKIRTVVLARLTFSTNLFWQMIGRGTRGLRCGGTADCFVVDPVALTDRFAFLEGYRPQVDASRAYTVLEKAGDGALDPRVHPVRHANVLPLSPPEVSPELREDVSEALRTFLATGRLNTAVLEDVAVQTWTREDGTLVSAFVPTGTSAPADASIDRSGSWGFDFAVGKLQDDLRSELAQPDIDLSWLKADMPSTLDSVHVKLFSAKLDFVRRRKLVTLEQFLHGQSEALMGG